MTTIDCRCGECEWCEAEFRIHADSMADFEGQVRI